MSNQLRIVAKDRNKVEEPLRVLKIEVDGAVFELRKKGGFLEIRSPEGYLCVFPVVSNIIQVGVTT